MALFKSVAYLEDVSLISLVSTMSGDDSDEDESSELPKKRRPSIMRKFPSLSEFNFKHHYSVNLDKFMDRHGIE